MHHGTKGKQSSPVLIYPVIRKKSGDCRRERSSLRFYIIRSEKSKLLHGDGKDARLVAFIQSLVNRSALTELVDYVHAGGYLAERCVITVETGVILVYDEELTGCTVGRIAARHV